MKKKGWGEISPSERAIETVYHEKKSDGVRVDHEKESDRVRSNHEKKGDGVRVGHDK